MPASAERVEAAAGRAPCAIRGRRRAGRRASNEGHAAIEDDGLSGHVAVAEHHRDRLRHFLGLAHAAERDVAGEIGPAAHHVGCDQRRRHRVDGDAFLDEPRRVAARQSFHAGLGGVVVHADGAGAARRTRGDVDDPAPLARPHHGQHGLRAQERRFQVDRDGAVEIVLGQIIDAAHDRDAGIVDENVDRAERGSDLFDHRSHGRRLRDIGRDRDGAAAAGLDPGDDGVGIIRALAVIDRDRGARFRERQRNRRADAAGCARHQRDMRAQILSVCHRNLT